MAVEEVDESGARLVALSVRSGERRILHRAEQALPLRPAVHPGGTRIALDASGRNVVRGEARARVGVLNLESGGLGWPRWSLDAHWRLGGATFDDTGRRLALEGAHGGRAAADVYVFDLAFQGDSVRDDLRCAVVNPAGLGVSSARFLPGGQQLVCLFNTRPEGAWEVHLADLGRVTVPETELPVETASAAVQPLTDGAHALLEPGLEYYPPRRRVFFVGQSRSRTRQRLRYTALDGGGQVDLGRDHLRIESFSVAPDGDLVAYAADGQIWLADADSGECVVLVPGDAAASHRGLVFDLEAGSLWFCTSDDEGARLRAVDLETRQVRDVRSLGANLTVVQMRSVGDASPVAGARESAPAPAVEGDFATTVSRAAPEPMPGRFAVKPAIARDTVPGEAEPLAPDDRSVTAVTPLPRPARPEGRAAANPTSPLKLDVPSGGATPRPDPDDLATDPRVVVPSRPPSGRVDLPLPATPFNDPDDATEPNLPAMTALREELAAERPAAPWPSREVVEGGPERPSARWPARDDAEGGTARISPDAPAPPPPQPAPRKVALRPPVEAPPPEPEGPELSAEVLASAEIVPDPEPEPEPVRAPEPPRPASPLDLARADFPGWMLQVRDAADPGRALSILVAAQSDPSLREAARAWLGQQLRQAGAQPEAVIDLIMALGAAAYLRLETAASTLRAFCERARDRVRAGGRLPEVEEHFALAALRSIDGAAPFDFGAVYDEYETMLAESAEALARGGDDAAARVMANFAALYADLAAEVLEGRRERSAPRAVAPAPTPPPATATPRPTPARAAERNEEEEAWRRQRAEALARAQVPPERRPAPLVTPSRRPPAPEDDEEAWSRAAAAARAQVTPRPQGRPAPAPAATPIPAPARRAESEEDDRSRAVPTRPRVSREDEEWARAAARARVATPTPTPAPRQATRGGSPTWDQIGLPAPQTPAPTPPPRRQPWYDEPARRDSNWARSNAELALDGNGLTESFEGTDPAIQTTPIPPTVAISGGVAALAGAAQLIAGVRLGLPFLLLGLLSVAAGLGLVGDRRWGWMLGLAAFASNALYWLVYAASDPPPWLPEPLLWAGALMSGVFFVLLLRPDVRHRYDRRRY